MEQRKKIYDKWVKIWLLAGVVLIFVQILIGGITRLTDSGLSITEWEVVKGTIPPLNAEQWQIAFEKYKSSANTQFENLHSTMDLGAFKKIYFWEYFHRLWAKSMGFIFLIPFLIFLFTKRFDQFLIKRLSIVFLLAVLVAVFGWIMVKSGLNADSRTWVSAYKLLVHLILAAILLAYLWWTYLSTLSVTKISISTGSRKVLKWIIICLFVQIAIGAIVAGMRAALIYPYWPFWNGPVSLFQQVALADFTLSNFIDYEPSISVKSIFQIFHRLVAYFILILYVLFVKRAYAGQKQRSSIIVMGIILLTQIILGIITVMKSVGTIPPTFGVLHQAFGFLFLLSSLFVLFVTRNTSSS